MSTIEPDDRVICCPECRSVFEAEDDTLVDVEAIVAARLASVEAQLRYAARPTMGYPGGDITPAEWAMTGPENLIRLALATCIRGAEAALRSSDAHTEQKGTGE